MTQTRTETLILMLMAIVILLMVAIAGLFFRMTQLQREVLTALGSFQSVSSAGEGLAIGTQAPDFSLADTDGHMVSLTDVMGKQVLLVFSSTHCAACTEVYPHLKAFSEGEQNVNVVMASRGTTEENRKLIEKQGFGFLVLTWEDAVANEYEVPGTPFFYVLDEGGIVTDKGFGNSLEQLEALVEAGGQ